MNQDGVPLIVTVCQEQRAFRTLAFNEPLVFHVPPEYEMPNTNEPKVVMLVSNPFNPDPRVYHEARTLVKNGIGVEVIAWDRLGTSQKDETVDGIRIHRVHVASDYGKTGVFAATLPLFWLSCLRILLRGRIRVLHCHDFDTLPVGVLVKLFKRCPLVFDAHEFYPGAVGDMVPFAVRQAIRVLHSITYRMADLVFTVSDAENSLFRHRNLVVIPNFPLLSQADTSHGIRAKGAFTILYYGRLTTDRGIKELLEIANEVPNARILIAGNGPLKEFVESASRENPRVEYFGWISSNEIEQILTTTNYVAILYRPDNLNNIIGMPNKLFEALKSGAIPIVYDGTAMANLARAEGFGLVVPFGDTAEIGRALVHLQDDEDQKAKLQLTGRNAFLRKYNWSTGESRLLGAYSRLLGGHSL